MTADEPVTAFVRTASRRDLEAVRQMLIETWHDTYDGLFGTEKVVELTDKWHSPESLERRLSIPQSEFIIADTGEEIVGMAFASQTGRRVQLHQLYVSPRAQGGGIGQSLLEEILFCFDEADALFLEVHPENDKAIRFYERNGFVRSGETVCNGHDGIPAILMELKLNEAV